MEFGKDFSLHVERIIFYCSEKNKVENFFDFCSVWHIYTLESFENWEERNQKKDKFRKLSLMVN